MVEWVNAKPWTVGYMAVMALLIELTAWGSR
jgi:hypothetical protein